MSWMPRRRKQSTDTPTRSPLWQMGRVLAQVTSTGQYLVSSGRGTRLATAPAGRNVAPGRRVPISRENERSQWRIEVPVVGANVIVIGAPKRTSSRGAVYVYSGTGYATETILTASDGAALDQLGYAVAVSEDGSVIVAAAPGADAVYVFSGPNWSVETKLTPQAYTSVSYAIGIAVSADGTYVAVGDSGGGPAIPNNGIAYLYSGAGWGTEQAFTSPNASADTFGISVALSGDGGVLAVGAYLDDNAGANAGAIYVYSGVSHATETILTPSDAVNTPSVDPGFRVDLGLHIAVSRDGSVVVGGAPQFDSSSTSRGAAYVYSGASWGTETKLTPSDAADDDLFGYSVAIAPDGTKVAVGGKFQSTGRIYVYAGASFATETILTRTDEAANDFLGYERIGINDTHVVAGIPYSSAQPTGASYLWSVSGGGEIQRFEAFDAASGMEFGVAQVISG